MPRIGSICLTILLLLLVSATAWGGYRPGHPLVVVGDDNYAPFEFLGPDGEPRGIFVDYWNVWSQETGVPVSYRLASWEEALRMVRSGEADVVSGMFRTEGREAAFDFGQSFYSVQGRIFFHKSIVGVRSLEDLRGFQVGVVKGDYAEEYLAAQAPYLRLALYESYEELVRAAVGGEVRVMIGDCPVIRFSLARNPAGSSFRWVEEALYRGKICPAVRKGDQRTLALLNDNTGLIPERRMDRIVEKWTGTSASSNLFLIWGGGIAAAFLLAALILLSLNRKLRRRMGWASDSLLRSEERYQLAVRGSNDGIWDWDRETDEVYYSPRWKAILGYEDQELPNEIEEWKSRIHPEDFERVMEANQSLFTEGADLFEVEYRLRHKDGSWRWVFGRGTCLRDESGAVRRMAGVHSDITRRRAMEEELRRSEESLREILENMMDGFYRTDMQGRLVMANPAMCSMLGYDRDTEVVGLDVAAAFYYNPEERKALLERIMDAGSVTYFSARLRHRDGSPVEVEANSRLIRDPRTGEHTGVEGIVRDIGERRRHEKELQRLIAKLESKNDELERFTYTVSHDLKSPIITIKGFLGLLERDIERGDAHRVTGDLARINNAADKMELLLRELLELSRVGRMDNPLVLVSLEEIAHEAVELSTGPLENAGGRVEGLETLPTVLCDRPRMVQVFLNLISNSVKFRDPARSLRIRVEASEQRDGVVIRFSDNGVGIKQEYLGTIFGLFQKLDQKQEGSGLGLALVRRIVENHGGRIWAESEGEGLGATFIFTLPRAGFQRA